VHRERATSNGSDACITIRLETMNAGKLAVNEMEFSM
jgi:hypothetical protein